MGICIFKSTLKKNTEVNINNNNKSKNTGSVKYLKIFEYAPKEVSVFENKSN